jgi:hypothetical protein
MWQGGGEIATPDGKHSAFALPATVQALRFWQDAIQQNVAPRNILGTGRAGGIRTHDLLNPIQAHYQAVLRPDAGEAQDAVPKWHFQAGKTIQSYRTCKERDSQGRPRAQFSIFYFK